MEELGPRPEITVDLTPEAEDDHLAQSADTLVVVKYLVVLGRPCGD